jgi:hypothetical protein
MTERYWEANNVPDVLLDWVDENVVAAIKDFWEVENINSWVDIKADRLVLVVAGPEKPINEDTGYEDIYTHTFDLIDEITVYSKPYADIGGPCCDEHKIDMIERATALKKLADEIAKLAADAYNEAIH